jgi:CP family cyanate transporter-like MFS transporter
LTSPSRTPGLPAPALSLAALLVVALALRPQLAAIGPLAPGIIEDLGVPYSFVGLLTTIPVLCMGLFAPFGPGLTRFTGIRSGITVSVGLLLVFSLLRPFAGGAAILLVLTLGVGIGTAVVGPILPMYVRSRLPLRMVAGTAAYAAGITIGAAIASTLAVPLESALGGWRGSLLALSIASVPAVLAWVVMVRTARPHETQGAAAGAAPTTANVRAPEPPEPRFIRPHLPLKRLIAWVLGLLFGMQSWLYYGVMAWLANVYTERGWAPATAALLLTLVSVTSLSGNVLVPWASRRGASRRSLLVLAAILASSGLLGVVLLPAPALLWATLMGIGLGTTFTLVLTLPTDVASDPREIGGAAALMFLVGYVIASLAPFALGAARDATGNFEASLWLLFAIAVAMIPVSWSLAPSRLRPPSRQSGAPGHREPVPAAQR